MCLQFILMLQVCCSIVFIKVVLQRTCDLKKRTIKASTQPRPQEHIQDQIFSWS